MATQIQVKLDTSANPPVTTIPQHASINRGNNEITWTPFAQQSFTFVSLTGLPTPPFSGLSVSSSQITVQDDNTATGDFPYTITVSYNGMNYSSDSSVHSARQSGNTTTTAKAALGGASSPTIKNN